MSEREKLVEKMKEIWSRIGKNEILMTHEITDEELPVGCSKIGGDPDVPQDFVWPVRADERPLSFLAQVNLDDAAKLDVDRLLPSSGLLSFFYDYEEQPWGEGPEDFDGWRVYYFENAKCLTRRTMPDEIKDADAWIWQESVALENRISIPDPYDAIAPEGNEALEAYADESECDEDPVDLYEEIAEELGFPCMHEEDETKLLGYPILIQNPMEERAAMLAASIFPDVPKEPSEWITLFQMGLWQKVEGGERMFGDVGAVTFLICKEDLKNKRFDRVMLEMQCY